MATNEDMPYEANNVLDASYIKEELEWLKSKAFVKGDDKRPRTKGLISSQVRHAETVFKTTMFFF